MMRQQLAAVVFLTVCVGLAARATAQSSLESEVESLKGLTGVTVLEENLSAEAEQDRLTRAAIQTDVEVKLRLAGISVLTSAQGLQTPGEPFLYVRVNAMKVSPTALNSYAYSIHVSLRQTIDSRVRPGATVLRHGA